MYKILISDMLGSAPEFENPHPETTEIIMKPGLSRAELLVEVAAYDALVVRGETRVDAELLAAAKRLKVIGRAGPNVDNIDVHEATHRGIVILNTPKASSIANAEHTVALMLAACRHTAVAHAALKEGSWDRNQFVGMQLYRKTLGLIGFGQVGRLVAGRAQAFGMDVLVYDPFISEEIGREYDVLLVDLEEIYSQADIISLHLPLMTENVGLISEAAIAQMKPGVVLINTARGKLIDQEALAAALKTGHVRAAAVDVYPTEPPQDNPLIGLPGALHTPHLGGNTQEAREEVTEQILAQVCDALVGRDYRNAINMPFYGDYTFAQVQPFMALAERLGMLHYHLANGPIRHVALEVRGKELDVLVKPIAAALLQGILSGALQTEVNVINAPFLAEKSGIVSTQTRGISPLDYPNLISCKVQWDGGERLLAGVLFGGSEPRLVQFDEYRLEAKPEGLVLVMLNRDVPGVVGQVGTILAAYEVNIGEWRMGRETPGGEALSFINLDSRPEQAVLNALEKIPAITKVKIIPL
jgi:D-3-phosphoglycerate dehydrogenase